MPEGHTLHRLADLHRRRYAGQPVAVSSPQGTVRRERGPRRRPRAGAHARPTASTCSTTTAPDLVVHVHLGLYGTFRDEQLPAMEPVGQVRMRMVGATHYADLRGATACELITDAEAAADARPPRGGPAARRRRPGPRMGPDLALPRAARDAAHGPVGDRRGRQRLPGGGAVPARLDPQLPGPGPAPASSGTRCGPTWSTCSRDGRPARASSRRCGRSTRRMSDGPVDASGSGCTSTGAPGSPASSAAGGWRTPSTPPATCSGARPASASRGDVPGNRAEPRPCLCSMVALPQRRCMKVALLQSGVGRRAGRRGPRGP